MQLKVNEIFYSIQGESLFAGCPCIFIRLTGCNLRCTYCDTRYAYTQGAEIPISEIITRIKAYPCQLVEITGGEPLLQNDTPHLIDRLIDEGYDVLLETNGSFDIGALNPKCCRVVDMKCPSSGEHENNYLANLKVLHAGDQLKFVIGNHSDFQFAVELIKKLDHNFPQSHILFSPIMGILQPAKLAVWILKQGLNVRLHLQQHKLIWPNEPRGH